jgi:hypothetical protein
MYSASGDFDPGVAFVVLLEAVVTRLEAKLLSPTLEEA